MTASNGSGQLNSKAAYSRWSLSLIIFGLILYTLLSAFIGARLASPRQSGERAIIDQTRRLSTLLKNKFAGTFLSNPAHLEIAIDHKNFQWLAYKREVALTIGHLTSGDDDYVPAQLQFQGESHQAKLRLKGDILDHLDSDKWSFRIKIKGETAIDGMRTFSIQHPKTRNHFAEWLYHDALKKAGVLSLRYEFIRVSVNGKDMGIYALEEHFDKQLMEHNQRREGIVLRFSEDLFWKQVDAVEKFKTMTPLTSAAFRSSDIDAFRSQQIFADTIQTELYFKALSLLRDFQNGALAAHQVFDIPQMAKYLAISELFGAQHSTSWRNMRFYYNPITTRLEPIGYDGYAGSPTPVLLANIAEYPYWNDTQEFHAMALQDRQLYAAYISALEWVASDAYLASFFDEPGPEFNRQLHNLYRDFPGYEVPLSVYELNRDLIRHVIYPPEGIRANVLDQSNNMVHLEIGSTQTLPIRLHGFRLGASTNIAAPPQSILKGKKVDEGIHYSRFSISLPDSLLAADLTVSYSLFGSDSIRTVGVVPHPSYFSEYVEGDLTRQPANTNQFDFLSVNEAGKQVTAKPGTWTIDEPLILPDGYVFNVSHATTFDLTNNALILARGPLHWAGTPEAPVRLHSSDSTGQGLVVLQADSLSVINHAIFHNLRSANHKAWSLTGAVTFHEAPVHFKNTLFAHNQSEDALNIVRTSFEMDSVRFEHVSSDAFDADYTTGRISHAVFTNLGNDGIDISGSELTFDDVRIDRAGDKALSAGEFSRLRGTNFDITNSEIAIASKDQSTATLSKGRISDSRVGFAIFQKKPEYGPAAVESEDILLENIDAPVLLEFGSHLLLNGELIEAAHQNVSDLLYGNLYGSASK